MARVRVRVPLAKHFCAPGNEGGGLRRVDATRIGVGTTTSADYGAANLPSEGIDESEVFAVSGERSVRRELLSYVRIHRILRALDSSRHPVVRPVPCESIRGAENQQRNPGE